MKLVDARSVITTALWLACGCGGGGAEEASGTFQIFPEKIYIGSDNGAHTYLAPIITVHAPDAVTWKIDDQAVATLAADSKNAKLTGLKAGTTMVHATSGGTTVHAEVTVYSYTAVQYNAGEMRYKTGFDDKNPACIDCHKAGKGPDHTATELDADSDEEVRNTYITGKDPENRPVDYMHEYDLLLKNYTHEWHVTEDEKDGLVAYLRALPIMGYPKFDEPTNEK